MNSGALRPQIATIRTGESGLPVLDHATIPLEEHFQDISLYSSGPKNTALMIFRTKS
jgi:hypothetical protein